MRNAKTYKAKWTESLFFARCFFRCFWSQFILTTSRYSPPLALVYFIFFNFLYTCGFFPFFFQLWCHFHCKHLHFIVDFFSLFALLKLNEEKAKKLNPNCAIVCMCWRKFQYFFLSFSLLLYFNDVHSIL